MSRLKLTLTIVLLVLLAATPFVLFFERQNLYDWWRLRSYTAPQAVAQLATSTTMDDYARKIFYVNRPQLQQSGSFRSSCTLAEQTIVLGCYREGVGIFLYNVQDTRLSGVQEVTSAHEMLHAAYSRLSGKERARLDTLTASVYSSLTDQRVRKNIEAYRTRDPSVVPNELHSILGTEVRNLPPELETYYKRYFDNRAAIVTFSEKYEAEFTRRDAEIASYDAQLKTIKQTIDSINTSLDAQEVEINKADQNLQSQLDARQVAAYNAGIPAYQRMINAYNAEVARLKQQIAQYNSLVEKRNSIVGEEQELMKAIDSSAVAKEK